MVYRDGVPIADLQGGEAHFRQEVDEATRQKAQDLLQPTLETPTNGHKPARPWARSFGR